MLTEFRASYSSRVNAIGAAARYVGIAQNESGCHCDGRDGCAGRVCVLPVVRRGGVLLDECFWASPMLNIMKPQGVLFFSMPVDEDAERRQNGGVFPDYFRVPVGASWKMSVTDRFPKDRKPWNKAENSRSQLSCEVRMMMVVMVLSVSWA